MARRYIRDSKGRFASSTGGTIKSVRAADTRAVGRFERKFADDPKAVMSKPRGVRRGGEIKTAKQEAQALRRIQKDYLFRENGQRKVDGRGLIQDIRISRRRRQSLTDWAGL